MNLPDGSFEEYKKPKAKEHIFDNTIIKTSHEFFPSISSNLFNHNLSPIKSKIEIGNDKSQAFSKLIERIKVVGGPAGIGGAPPISSNKRANLEQFLSANINTITNNAINNLQTSIISPDYN